MPETEKFLAELEHFADRRFLYRLEVGFLFELSRGEGKEKVFNELTFLGKFLTHASAILRRNNPGEHDTVPLREEFHQSLERSASLMGELLRLAPPEKGEEFRRRFLTPSRVNLEHLLDFLADLGWVKNYSIDMSSRRR